MREIRDVTVGELMSKPAVTVTPETTVEALRDLMAKYDFNAFPVVNDADVLLGLVTRLDLFRLYLLRYARFMPAIEETWVSSVGAIMSRGAAPDDMSVSVTSGGLVLHYGSLDELVFVLLNLSLTAGGEA